MPGHMQARAFLFQLMLSEGAETFPRSWGMGSQGFDGRFRKQFMGSNKIEK